MYNAIEFKTYMSRNLENGLFMPTLAIYDVDSGKQIAFKYNKTVSSAYGEKRFFETWLSNGKKTLSEILKKFTVVDEACRL